MKTADKEKLWDAYRQKKTQETREQLIIEYAQLVKLVAGRLSMYLGHNVEYDDLVSYGIFGLIDAIDKFDLEKNVKFETYASLRIRGAILDQIRKMDWIPRTLRQKQKRMESAAAKVETDTGRPATDEEVAAELGITKDEYEGWKAEAEFTNVVSLDDYLEQHSEAKIDYIHGEDVVSKLGNEAGNMGFFLPDIEKNDLFRGVIIDGVLPRKTFSMGEAHEKRYYMESKMIVK